MDTAARFPSLTTAPANAKRLARFVTALQVLEAGQQAGSILNPAFIEAKAVITWMVEKAWDAVIHDMIGAAAYESQTQEVRQWVGNHPFPHSGVSRFGAALEKWFKTRPADASVEEFVKRATVLMQEAKTVGALLDEMKGKVVKRQPKTEEERKAAFAPPPVSTEATIRVKTVLETLVNEQFEALVKRMAERYSDEVSRFIEKRDQRVAEIAASDKPNRAYTLTLYLREARYANVSFLTKVLDDDYGRATPQVKVDAMEIIAKLAREDAEEIRSFFVAKNLRKIVSIIEAKEKAGVAMTKCDPVKHTISLGGLEGAFVVAFADGSGFTFSNAVVFKINSYGTQFNQFPLTFHGVTLAGGVKMPRPSEERMNTVFVGKEKV